MGSTNRKLAETIRLADTFKKTLKCQAHKNEYNRGLYNGFEMIRALLCNQDPDIIEKLKAEDRKEILRAQIIGKRK